MCSHINASLFNRPSFELLGEIAKLSVVQRERLRTEVITRRAARTFAIAPGAYVVEDQVCLPVRACDVDIRAVVYQGIRMHLSQDRVATELRQLGGTRFVLEPHASDELHQFGFCDGEWPILAALRSGASLPELEARHREVDPRAMQAAILALVACGTARVVAVARAPTPQEQIAIPRTKTNPELDLRQSGPRSHIRDAEHMHGGTCRYSGRTPNLGGENATNRPAAARMRLFRVRIPRCGTPRGRTNGVGTRCRQFDQLERQAR